MTRVELEWLTLQARRVFVREHMDAMASTVEVRAYYDTTVKAMAVQMVAHVLGAPDDILVIQYPATWRDHLKDHLGATLHRRSRPVAWVLRWVLEHLAPVEHTAHRVKRYYALCPHLTAPPHLHVQFMAEAAPPKWHQALPGPEDTTT